MATSEQAGGESPQNAAENAPNAGSGAPEPPKAEAPKPADHGHGHGSKWAMMLAALGVVYGDIGTSPLYAIKECFSPESTHRVSVSEGNVLGVLSLVFWSLMAVVTVKYLTFIMRADNEGSGGILALLALLPSKEGKEHAKDGGRVLLIPLVLFGAALLYGDGVITPAISVLSAVEGLEVPAPELHKAVIPITVGILVGLFVMQKRGTDGIGKLFGPLMLVWFFAIAVFGMRAIVGNVSVLKAVNPMHAVSFFAENKGHGFLILGSVVLCITGGEALYADMGHFGRLPIRNTWYAVVLPALLINYFGQGAKLLMFAGRDDKVAEAVFKNPFYALVPDAPYVYYPVVAIATAATVVASQALISGAFSLTQQAIQLGFFPRLTIVHTSKETEGQIYIPEINWALLVACIAVVLGFGSSTALAAAYGIAVTGTMSITTIVYFVVITERWKWPLYKALPIAALFLFFDVGYFAANAAKLKDGPGGWVPLIMAACLFIMMTTWKAGRAALGAFIREAALPLQMFLDDLKSNPLHRVRGTAVFMASNPDATPPVLLHHVKHNQVLHKQVVLLSVHSERIPEVPADRRIEVRDKGEGIYQVIARYGFMQTPNVPSVMEQCKAHGIRHEMNSTSYYLGRETLLTSGKSKMSRWRKALFAFLSKNARTATAYFGLTPNRVVELGMQIDL